MSLHLRVETPETAPVDRTVDASEVLIGRAASAGIVINDASVSRQHARIVRRDDGWWIEGLSTTNPTSVNDAVVDAPRAIKAGDVIALGHTALRVLGDAPASAAPTPVAPAPPEPAPVSDEDARQAARLRTLNDIHRALATPISLAELLDLILERCFEVLRPEEGVILLREVGGDLQQAASRRTKPGNAPVVVSRRIVDEVVGKGKPTLVLDAAMDDRFSNSESIIVSGVKSVLAAPLVDAEGTIGMVALSSSVAVRQFSQQDLDMLESLASAAALRVRNVALAEEAAARRVLEREMALAHDMQMSMLPRRMPDRPEIDVAASLTPARSVGGDLYDFVLAGDRLWFIVGDVSGKGMAASLYMAVAKTLFRATVQIEDIELPEVLARMNRELCRDNEQMIFITALVGHLALATGEVALGDAGHNPAVLIGPDRTLGAPSVPKSIAFGVLEDAEFSESRFALERGATLLLYTDGATDARNPGGEIFGEAALTRAIEVAAGGAAADLVSGVVQTVDNFAAGAPPEDDLTLFAIRYLGPDA